MGYNISDVSGNGTGTTSSGLDGWEFTGDLSANPGLTTISGDFDVVSDGVSEGEASSYTFSALSTTQFGTLSTNSSDGTFTFTIDKSALYASGSDQVVTFTVTGGDGISSDTDSVSIRLLICLARGTLIETPQGPVRVEDLEVGDLVRTADGRAEPLRWVGSRRVSSAELDQHLHLRPVRIQAGALGAGVPARDLIVSPQHRVLIRGWRAELYFGEAEVLVPAKALINDHSIRVDHPADGVEYFHLLFDRHEMIVTEGATTESFHPGQYSVSALGAAVQTELWQLFGGRPAYAAARPVLTVREAAVLGVPAA
ncbi:Hint domain-containing protein [Frigidibacter sp. ROC022]|uniref:Hint domain-containing protein n=1 Tax=Frigidibacter sp. ROC022 TaxID=2971796 RepID=UPI00215B2B55|nr:Hint domain-containing protein [Frigidibacter sp. ROC022]MCR8724458.1 Hint domain-containing protein [Frigidibacter sp. ROC022]